MSARLCPSCRDWRKCSGYNYYLPAEIEANFCFYQCIWIIDYRESLSDGKYPPDPTPTGYVGSSFSGIRAGAKFLRPAEIVAEFDRRLKRTGKAGKTLIHEVTMLDAQRPDRLSQTARDALYYCAGRDSKRLTFNNWLKQREYRNKLSKIRLTMTTI